MSDEDIRWIQRLSNYSRALSQLREFIEKGELNKFEEQGLIKAFIINRYFPEFEKLHSKMETFRKKAT